MGSNRLLLQLGTLSITRVILTTAYRMVYPFLGVFARGLGVSLQAMALIVAARSLIGLASPIVGGFSDRAGRKPAMLCGAALFVLGMMTVGTRPTYVSLLLGVVIASAGKVIFDPASQAHVGDIVPYRRRGLAVATVELSWSGAFLLGVPTAAWLIERGDWARPFVVLGIAGAVTFFLLAAILPRGVSVAGPRSPSPGLVNALRKTPSAIPALGAVVAGTVGAQIFFVSYGVWLESAHRVSVATLATVTASFGLAELVGELIVAVATDRLGKRRSLLLGLPLSSLTYLTVPLLGTTLGGAILALGLIFVAFEFFLVSAISLVTELAPDARGQIMSANVAALEVAHGIGALLGPWLLGFGIAGNSVAAACLGLIAFGLVLTRVRHG